MFYSSLMIGRNGNDRSSAKQPDSGEDTTRSRRSHGSLQADASHELAARVAHGGGVRGRCGELLAVVRWLCCWHVSLYKKRRRESDEREKKSLPPKKMFLRVVVWGVVCQHTPMSKLFFRTRLLSLALF